MSPMTTAVVSFTFGVLTIAVVAAVSAVLVWVFGSDEHDVYPGDDGPVLSTGEPVSSASCPCPQCRRLARGLAAGLVPARWTDRDDRRVQRHLRSVGGA